MAEGRPCPYLCCSRGEDSHWGKLRAQYQVTQACCMLAAPTALPLPSHMTSGILRHHQSLLSSSLMFEVKERTVAGTQ